MKITLALESSQRPKYQQIAEQIRSAILARELSSGVILPPVRDLARQLQVGRMTVSRAYSELEELGFIKSTVGSGSIVCEPSGSEYGRSVLQGSEVRGPFSSFENTVSKTGMRSLATAMPDPTLFESDEFIAYYSDLRGCDPWLYYSGETVGHVELITAIQEIMKRKGRRVPLGQIAVTSGLENSIQTAILSLTAPGDPILIQDPFHMNKPSELAERLGRQAINIPFHPSGFDLIQVENLIKQTSARLFILSGGLTTPYGRRLESSQVERILELAEKHGVYILELDTFGWMSFEPSKPETYFQYDQNDQVIYCGSFDHMLTAGIRTGWLCCPARVMSTIENYMQLSQVSGSPFIQYALGRYIHDGKLSAHCNRVLPEYRLRRDTMHRVILSSFPDTCEWIRPEGGLTFWVKMPDKLNTRELARVALNSGVIFCPGFRISNQADSDQYLRLGFGLLRAEGIHHAVRTLGELVPLC